MCRKLLWIDCSGGLLVGVVLLAASAWLSNLYGLPRDLVLLIGAANALYGCYSLFLATRPQRTRWQILLLIAANGAWALLCVRWAVLYAGEASLFGMIHLIGEAAIVGGLALLEWRCREALISGAESASS